MVLSNIIKTEPEEDLQVVLPLAAAVAVIKQKPAVEAVKEELELFHEDINQNLDVDSREDSSADICDCRDA